MGDLDTKFGVDVRDGGEPSRKGADEGWGKKGEWVGRKNQTRCFCLQIRMKVVVVLGR